MRRRPRWRKWSKEGSCSSSRSSRLGKWREEEQEEEEEEEEEEVTTKRGGGKAKKRRVGPKGGRTPEEGRRGAEARIILKISLK